MQQMEFRECNKLVNNNQNTMHSSENVLLIFNKFEHKSILPKNVKIYDMEIIIRIYHSACHFWHLIFDNMPFNILTI